MNFLDHSGYIIDLDGVVWRGKELIPGSDTAINKLRALGKKLCFLTNNASEHRRTQVQKLISMGIEAHFSEMLTSGYATALYLRETFGPQKIFSLGNEELNEELREAGHSIVESRADCVVTGLNLEFNYERLAKAFHNILSGAKFIASNRNPVHPTERGPMPGSAVIVAALATCAGREPDIIVGKPHKPIMDMTLKLLNLSGPECVVIGDIPSIDLQGGVLINAHTAFVQSGVGTLEDLRKSNISATYVAKDFAGLLSSL